MVVFILICCLILMMASFMLGAYLVKLWYLVPERKMTAAERKFNKLLQFLIVESWYPY